MKFLKYFTGLMVALGLVLQQFGASAQTTSIIQQEIIKVPGITSDSMICGLTATQKQTSRIYNDGLGRPVQQVLVQASPLLKNIIIPIAYDANGNQPKAYLPYVGSGGSGMFRANAITSEQPAFTITARRIGSR